MEKEPTGNVFQVPEGYYDSVAPADKPLYEAFIRSFQECGIVDPVEAAAVINAQLIKTGVTNTATPEEITSHIKAPQQLLRLLLRDIQSNADPEFVVESIRKIREAATIARSGLDAGIFKMIGKDK